jgi:hypothetical protein
LATSCARISSVGPALGRHPSRSIPVGHDPANQRA